MMNKNTKVGNAFDTRIARICKSLMIEKLGDFENSSLDVFGLIAGAGDKTVEVVRDTLREANIRTLDDKIEELMRQRELIKEYIMLKRSLVHKEAQLRSYEQEKMRFQEVQKSLKKSRA